MILQAALEWDRGRLDDEGLLKLLTSIESLLVRRYVVSVPPNDLRSMFTAAMVNLMNDVRGFLEGVLGQLQTERFRWPRDSDFTRALLNDPIYRAAAKYPGHILTAIAKKLQGRECPAIRIGSQSGDFSIEHVLPQTLTDGWRDDLEAWGQGDVNEFHETKLHVIGNLTLTAYNSELSNKPFLEKVQIIKGTTSLRLSREIAENETGKWTAEEINKRSQALAKVAIDIWPGPS